MSQRQETFYVNGVGYIGRGEALRALIAATYNTAKRFRTFTTDDVFARLDKYPEHAFRVAVSGSKLIAVALRKAARDGMCEHAQGLAPDGPVCHSRKKGVWVSKIADPRLTTDPTL